MVRKTTLAGVAGLCLAAFVLIAESAEAVEVQVSREDCLRLTNYIPDGSVAADYKPGVDSRGRPVAPADYGTAGVIQPPEVYRFDVELNPFPRDRVRLQESRLNEVDTTIALTKREIAAMEAAGDDTSASEAALGNLEAERASLLDGLAASDRRPGERSKLSVGEVTVTQDGAVFWNGQPLQDPNIVLLTEKCRELLRR